MRKIKFRTWDREANKYIIQFDGERIDNILRYYEINPHCEYPEQYTGLKDKNGKEIYEGDICARADGEKCKMVFYANSWCMDMSSYYPLCREGWCEEIKGNPQLEIIGNIHEQTNNHLE